MSEPSVDEMIEQTLNLIEKIPFVDYLEKIVETLEHPKLYRMGVELLEKKKRQNNMDNYKEFDNIMYGGYKKPDIIKMNEKGIMFNTIDECSVHIISFD
jgi:hypothetical protein